MGGGGLSVHLGPDLLCNEGLGGRFLRDPLGEAPLRASPVPARHRVPESPAASALLGVLSEARVGDRLPLQDPEHLRRRGGHGEDGESVQKTRPRFHSGRGRGSGCTFDMLGRE